MAKFLNRFQVTEELQKIIEDAEDYLILISPYFKLNEIIKRSLSKLRNKQKFELIIVYGKNEDNRSKSLSDADLDFLKSFPNVEIRYHKKLHAKIYLNEVNCLLTSMNLHDYSMNENIEFGVLTQSKMVDLVAGVANLFKDNLLPGSLDQNAFEFAEYIVEKSSVEYSTHVKKEKSFFGLFTKYGETVVEVDKNRYGYCIRLGTKIPFNPAYPYSAEAYTSWAKYKNPDYLEKYCHSCGESHKASMQKPVCKRCYLKN